MSAQADAAGGKQSRRMSLVEAIANVLLGYVINSVVRGVGGGRL
jgi:hypothetical protein